MPRDLTTFRHRQPGYSLLVLSQWRDVAETERNVAWTRETYGGMEPFTRAERYMNFLDGDDASPAGIREAYGRNYHRLTSVKAAYDPENVFRQNVNVSPAQ